MNKSICFISLSAYGYFNESAPAGGGAQRQFYLLSTKLVDHFDVQFVVGDYGQPVTEQRDGVTLHRAYTPSRSTTLSRRGKQLLHLQRALTRANAEIYILRCPPRKLAIVYPLVTALRSNLVYHIATDSFVSENPPGLSGFTKRLYNRAVRKSTVVAQTEHQANKIKNNWNVDATIIPNGYPSSRMVDRHEFRDFFLWVGRLDEAEKRPHIFLDLADELQDEEFVLVGPPEKDNEYSRQVIQRATETKNVTYTGQIPPSAVHEYYRKAVALINTSVHGQEGFPNTFLEAWRYATPVIALSMSTARFLDAETEIEVYTNSDFEEFVQLARRVSDDIQFRRELGIVGIKSFERHYRIEDISNRYKSLLEALLG